MSECEPIEVEIYKTARRAETFLFVPAGVSPDAWPDGLSETFSPAERVMALTLTERQPLAASLLEARLMRGHGGLRREDNLAAGVQRGHCRGVQRGP